MPLATRDRIWAELPPLEEEPVVTVEKKTEKEVVNGVEVVKVTEVRTSTVRKLKCVEERKKWALFGLKPEDVASNDSMTDREEPSWELPVVEKSKAPVSAADKKEYEVCDCDAFRVCCVCVLFFTCFCCVVLCSNWENRMCGAVTAVVRTFRISARSGASRARPR